MGIAKPFRIKKANDFQNVFDQHNSFANQYFVIYKYQNPVNSNFRLGISVGKKVGKAHERVWVKRRIRASIQAIIDQFPNDLDLLVIARPITNGKDQNQINQQLLDVLKKANLI